MLVLHKFSELACIPITIDMIVYYMQYVDISQIKTISSYRWLLDGAIGSWQFVDPIVDELSSLILLMTQYDVAMCGSKKITWDYSTDTLFYSILPCTNVTHAWSSSKT